MTDTIPQAIHIWLKTNLRAEKDSIKNLKVKISEFAQDIYEKQFEYVIKTFNKDFFITQGTLANQINRITQKILKANPEIPQETRVLVYRSDIVNAVSYGNGIIALNLGLLTRSESDDQLAFMIGHELAHVHLRHTQQHIRKIAELNFDKELRKKFQAARSSMYGSYTKLQELMTSVELSLNRHSQIDELEADSMSLGYIIRAGYDPRASIRCMEILDSAEFASDQSLINFESHFKNSAYPVKEHWLKYEKSDTWHNPHEKEDSVKTHPSCKLRRLALIKQMYRGGLDTIQTKNAKDYTIKTLSWFELVGSHLYMKDYGKALYTSLLLLNKHPNNPYLQSVVSQSLFQIYISQKKHELSKAVELPYSGHPENYDRVLTFIHNLRLNEIGAIAYHYTISRPIESLSNEHMMFGLWLVSFLDISTLDTESIKSDYLNQYPEGWYKDAIKNKPKF